MTHEQSRIRFRALYVLVALNVVMLVAGGLLALYVKGVSDRVIAGCERGNVIRQAARSVLLDPTLVTPKRREYANDPALKEQRC